MLVNRIELIPLKKEQILSLPRLPFRQTSMCQCVYSFIYQDESRDSNPKYSEPQPDALPLS